MALKPVPEAISAYTDGTGTPPKTLRELFAEGLPEGLAWKKVPSTRSESVTLEVPRRNPVDFSYGPALWLNPPKGVDTESHELRFRHFASAVNSCAWTTDERRWQCGWYH